ncbi:hypothetical protein ACFLS1_04855 [Verrucomicrobiota bacterium]
MNNKNKITILLSLIILSTVIIRITFFAISIKNVPTSSDEALSPLQAKQILQSHTPLLVMANTYQFPVESYLYTPFVKMLPRNAFGARIIPFLISLGTTALLLLILIKLGSLKTTWPALLLITFPSAYLLMLFAAYALPQHNSCMFLSCAAIFTAMIQKERKILWLATASGFLAGLATSNHLITIPVLLTLTVYCCLNSRWKTTLKKTSFFLTGALTGLAPYFVAKYLLGAYSAVTKTYPVKMALKRCWEPTLNYTIPKAFGMNPCVFPDGHDTISIIPGLETIFSISFIIVILTATIIRTYQFFTRTTYDKRISIQTNDVFLGISWLCFFLFVSNTRSFSHSYRYFLLLMLCFPFLVSYLYSISNSLFRRIIGSYAIILTGLNLTFSILLIHTWTTHNFAAERANIIDIQPAIEFLKEKEIKHCNASYWAAYRINYETDGEILCSQPFNERFPGWHTPYKQTVDNASNVAYVLTKNIKYLKPHIFDRHLKTMGIKSKKQNCGDFFVYYDFLKNTDNDLIPLPIISARTSDNNTNASILNDNIPDNIWRTTHFQNEGMWIEIELEKPTTVSTLKLSYGQYFHDHAPELDILVHTGKDFQRIKTVTENYLDKFVFKNNHPVYGDSIQTIPVPPVRCKIIRLEIKKPSPEHAWTIGEIDVL